MIKGNPDQKGVAMQNQLTVHLDNNLEQKLAGLERRFQQKRSVIVRKALERFIDEEMASEDNSVWDKVQHLAGSVTSGISDLGEEHSKHLHTKLGRNA